jgi:hypothetical protein
MNKKEKIYLTVILSMIFILILTVILLSKHCPACKNVYKESMQLSGSPIVVYKINNK